MSDLAETRSSRDLSGFDHLLALWVLCESAIRDGGERKGNMREAPDGAAECGEV